CFATTITMHDLVVDLFINRYACGVAVSYGINSFVYWVIVTVRQQSAHSFSSLHSIQGAGKGNLNRNYERTYGLCASRIRGSASSVKCGRTVTLYTSVLRGGVARPWRGAAGPRRRARTSRSASKMLARVGGSTQISVRRLTLSAASATI